MPSPKIIVFGPTGAVGSAAARTALELGGHVVLAMRDTSKPIPGLAAAQEQHGNCERVHADLTKSDTVHDAVQQTQAKHAFIYLAHGTPDNMKSTVEALKSGGVEMVVFLSSFTVQGDLTAIQQSDLIPYMHAQVELNLIDTFGRDNYIALRPGYFASNTLQYKAGLLQGLVKIYMPDAKVDCIVPEDIGRVGGHALVEGPPGGERVLYLYGPELLSQREVVEILAKVLGKEIKIEAQDEKEAYKTFMERGYPEVLADYMVRSLGKVEGGQNQVIGYPVDVTGLKNVEKYSGKSGTRFVDWVEQSKQVFVA